MEYMRNRLHQQAHAGHSIHFGALDCRRAHLLRSNGNMFSTCFDRCLPRSCFVFCVPFENHVLSDGSMRSCGHLTFFPDIYVCIYIIIHIRHIHIHIHIHTYIYIYYIDIYIYIMRSQKRHTIYIKVYQTRKGLWICDRNCMSGLLVRQGVHRWSSFSWSSMKKLPWPALWVTLVPPLGHGMAMGCTVKQHGAIGISKGHRCQVPDLYSAPI